MKLLGVLGGMSWTSTETYYRLLNQRTAERLGGLHSARLLVHSVDFDEIAELQHADDWSATAEILGRAARGLADAGAEGLIIATNTMHKVADDIEAASGLPLLHIADATARAVLDAGVRRVGLLATAFTMEDTFYVGRLAAHGIETIVPAPDTRAEVHVRDVLRPESRDVFRRVMADLVAEGAEGIVFGCTEVGLLVGPDDTGVPTFDTVALHAAAAVDWMLSPSR
jgi:aspartate racemase